MDKKIIPNQDNIKWKKTAPKIENIDGYKKTIHANPIGIITDITTDKKSGNTLFSIAVGIVNIYTDNKSLEYDIEQKFMDEGFTVSKGKNTGIFGIQHSELKKGQRIEIEIKKDETATIFISDKTTNKSTAANTIDSAFIKSMGFDLNPENTDSHGKKLSDQLTIYLLEKAGLKDINIDKEIIGSYKPELTNKYPMTKSDSSLFSNDPLNQKLFMPRTGAIGWKRQKTENTKQISLPFINTPAEYNVSVDEPASKENILKGLGKTEKTGAYIDPAQAQRWGLEKNDAIQSKPTNPIKLNINTEYNVSVDEPVSKENIIKGFGKTEKTGAYIDPAQAQRWGLEKNQKLSFFGNPFKWIKNIFSSNDELNTQKVTDQDNRVNRNSSKGNL